MRTLTFLASSLLLATGGVAGAACDLRAVSATTCDQFGNAYVPKVGDLLYYVKFTWTLSGTAMANYRVRMTLGGQSVLVGPFNRTPGTYRTVIGAVCPTDEALPLEIVIDPEAVSGDTNRANNTLRGSVTAALPANAIEYFGSQRVTGTQNLTATFAPFSGFVDEADQFFSRPVTDSFQTIVSAPGGSGSTLWTSTPFGYPVWETIVGRAAAGVFSFNQRFVADVRSVRISQPRLRTSTWIALGNLPTSIRPYLQPESRIQVGHAAVAAFVGRSLPSGYRTSMAPIDAARALFKGVLRELSLVDRPGLSDAVQTLSDRTGNEADLSLVYVATLRKIGIPARTVTGWRMGVNQWRTWSEFYLPNVGWIPQDVGTAERLSPTGAFSFFFATVPDLNQRCAVGRVNTMNADGFVFPTLQTGFFWFWGNATLTSIGASCSLVPGG